MTDAALPLPRINARAAFGATLIVVTSIPFVTGGVQWLTGTTPFFPLQAVVIALAAIHVPMTAYLLFDPAIRKMMRDRPIALIVMPLLILAAVVGVYFLTNRTRAQGTSALFVYFMYFVTAWNLWHFGKQNVGVYSFFRASQSQTGMLPIERKLIVVGAVLGVLSTFPVVGDSIIKQNASKEDMDWLMVLTKHVTTVGTIGQVGLFAVVVVVLWMYRERHNWLSAVMFFLSTNFFFAYYVVATGADFGFVFACGTFAHGLQYLTFLGFHAGNSGSWSRSAAWVMPVAFVLVAAILIDLFQFNLLFSSTLLAAPLTYLGVHDQLIASLLFTLNVGILLVHFWLDSYFWRFKEPQSRNWMISRYAFLLKRP